MTNYFISDVHFGHKNCLAFDNRPFSDIESHDNAIISNWNNVVNIDDDVYILGDISWHNVTNTIEILKKLNGRLHLIIGNHDHAFLKNGQFRNMFVEIAHYKELDIGNGVKVILCHYPLISYNGQFRKANIHLYGHVHCSQQWQMIEYMKRITEEERGEGTARLYNVGAMLDYIRYCPRTLEEILNACEKRSSLDIVEKNKRMYSDK